MRHLNVNPKKASISSVLGFTLLEVIIITVMVGILAAISAPSLLTWYNNVQVKDALAKARGALQQSREDAVRRSQTCTAEIDKSNSNAITGSCAIEPDFSSRIGLSTNAANNKVAFSFRGTNTIGNSGTVVFFIENAPDQHDKKCLVMSSPLGIVRTGAYTGDVNSPTPANCDTQSEDK
ncbi:MAG: hypothetical protein GVY17_03405 [Cyanobacteria bacterium]|jgi:type II secretory pathway pseudopilin PulG|nr:hypothetical protein [Cyanobacteria bacterium GSL.Bin21]